MPRIDFGRPKNMAGEDFWTWWHLPIEPKPRFFQWKSINDCAISVYIHGGGVGTIEQEVNLCGERKAALKEQLPYTKQFSFLAQRSFQDRRVDACRTKHATH